MLAERSLRVANRIAFRRPASSLVTNFDNAVYHLSMRHSVRYTYADKNMSWTALELNSQINVHANALLEFYSKSCKKITLWMPKPTEKHLRLSAAKAGIKIVDLLRSFLTAFNCKVIYFKPENNKEIALLLRKAFPECFDYDKYSKAKRGASYCVPQCTSTGLSGVAFSHRHPATSTIQRCGFSTLALQRSRAAVNLKAMVLDTIVSAAEHGDRRSTAKICEDAVFKTSLEHYYDRQEQMEEVDARLSLRVTKNLRTLNVMIASPGMGKSRFLDTFACRLLQRINLDAPYQLVPVLVSFNTDQFGDSCHPASAAVTLGARILVSALSPNLSQELVQDVMEKLSEIATTHRLVDLTLLDLCVDVTLHLLKDKLSLAYLPRVFLGIDEVGKADLSVPGMSERIIKLATKYLDISRFENSAEYKTDPSRWGFLSDSLPDKYSLLVTDLFKLDLFDRIMAYSSRDTVRIGLPQLSHKSCIQLMTEQYAGSRLSPTQVANLAVISAGHPRTIDVLGKAVLQCPGQGRLTASEVVTQALKLEKLKKPLGPKEIVFALLHNELTITEASSNPLVVDNISFGNFQTAYFGDNHLRITVSPLVLHYSLQQIAASNALPPDTLHLLNALLLVDKDHPFGDALFSKYLQYGRHQRNYVGNLYADFHLCAMLVRKQLLRRYREVDSIAQTDGQLYGEPLAEVGNLANVVCSLDPYAHGREAKVVVLSDRKLHFPNAAQVDELLETLQEGCAGSAADCLKINNVMENRGDIQLLLKLLYELSVVVVPGFSMQKGYDYFSVEKAAASFQDRDGNKHHNFIRAVEPSFQPLEEDEFAITEEQVLNKLTTKIDFVFKEAEWHLLGASAGQVMHELVLYGKFLPGLNTARLTKFLRNSSAMNAMILTTPALHKAYGGLSSISSYYYKNKPVEL